MADSGEQPNRTEYESKDWCSKFMALACLLSARSKDEVRKVGACIVDPKGRVIGQGYNGMLNKAPTDGFPWAKSTLKPNALENKNLFVCHAEMNAIAFSRTQDFRGCTMYVSTFPCIECAKRIKEVGMVSVYFLDPQRYESRKPEVEAAVVVLDNILRESVIHYKVTFDFQHCKVIFDSEKRESKLPNRKPQPDSSDDDVSDITTFRCTEDDDEEVTKMKWKDIFFAICLLEAEKSKGKKKFGACVVNEDNHLVGWGHNRSLTEDDDNPLYEVHAEMNAVFSAGPNLKNATLYTLQHPCNECAKSMIQRGVRKIVFLQPQPDGDKFQAASFMFKTMGVGVSRHFERLDKKVNVIFTDGETQPSKGESGAQRKKQKR